MTEIERLHKEWTELQPLSDEDRKRLDQKFMLEFNYNSNNIEGNTLTYGQTKLLLMFGETSGDAKLRDYEEMKAHNVGLKLMIREAKDYNRPLTEGFVRELNSKILVEDFYKAQITDIGINRYKVRVGQYKTRPNSVITITGELFDYASPEETPALMSDLISWYNEEENEGKLSPVQLAALFHYRFIRIHPFEDGNGRIARLLVNYILLRHNYPMIIVESRDKDNYLTSLHKCDIYIGLNPSDGANATIEQIEPFLGYTIDLVEHALKISIRAAKGESIEEDDDFAKQIALLEQEAKKVKTKTQFSTNEVWNVLELFYFPLQKKIVDSLKPATSFFSHYALSNLISKSYMMSDTIHINNIYRDTNNTQINDFVSNAKTFFFKYEMKSPKLEYKIEDLEISIMFDIKFEDYYYTVSNLKNKQFDYGSYPSDEEVDGIIRKYKEEVLEKIEKRIKD